MSSVSKPRVRHNRHKQGLNLTLEKLSADFRNLYNSPYDFLTENDYLCTMNNYETILIVDDNAAILTAMRYLLDATFEQVLTTSTPDDILKLMAQQPIDLVVLDMNFTLGVNTGNEGLFWLRTIRKQHPQTPVVLLTAYADVNLAVKGLKNGAADFITKPWDNDELVRKLKDVLDMQNEIVSLDEMEKEHIRRTIDHCHGNLTKAAELLGITRQTLYNKMKRL